MRIPKGQKVHIRINGELITLDINKDFSIEEGVELLPKFLAYLVSLKSRLYKLKLERDFDRDKYYYEQFLYLKDLDGEPRANEWVKAEIFSDEKYLERVELANQTDYNYRLVYDLVRAYEAKITIAKVQHSEKWSERKLS